MYCDTADWEMFKHIGGRCDAAHMGDIHENLECFENINSFFVHAAVHPINLIYLPKRCYGHMEPSSNFGLTSFHRTRYTYFSSNTLH